MITKINQLYKNPIKLFGVITILLSIVLLYSCHFHLPDFYTDKELADEIAQSVTSREVAQAVHHLLNPQYNIYNWLFQIWGWFITFFIFSMCFKINEFNRTNEIKELNQKSSLKDDKNSVKYGNYIYENKGLKESSKEENFASGNKSMNKVIKIVEEEKKKEKELIQVNLKHANKNIKTYKKRTYNYKKRYNLEDEPKNWKKNISIKKDDKIEDIFENNLASNRGKGNTNQKSKKLNNVLPKEKKLCSKFVNQRIKIYYNLRGEADSRLGFRFSRFGYS